MWSTLSKQTPSAARNVLIATIFSLVIVISGCTDGTSRKSGAEKPAQPELAWHADNDIAMTVRSLTDALIVDGRIDSTDYDFEGILTDGRGRPLYTDISGAPGEWIVDVIDPKRVDIRNVKLGDLLPDDLQEYVLAALNIGETSRVETEEYDDDDDTDVDVYDFGKGIIRFERRQAQTQGGLDATFMNIVITAKS